MRSGSDAIINHEKHKDFICRNKNAHPPQRKMGFKSVRPSVSHKILILIWSIGYIDVFIPIPLIIIVKEVSLPAFDIFL